MLPRIFAAVIALLVAVMGTAAAAERDAINGVWKGTYACGGEVAKLSVVLDESGDRFIFAYPNGLHGEYSLEVSFNLGRRQIFAKPLQWVDQPQGSTMVGFDGIVSENVDVIKGSVRSCGKFELKRVVDAKASEANLGGKSKPTVSKGNSKNAATSFYDTVWEGAWRGKATQCEESPLEVVLIVAPSKSMTGTARVLLRREHDAEWFEYEARTEERRASSWLSMTIETPKAGPIREMFDFDIVKDPSDGSKWLAGSYRLQCRQFEVAKIKKKDIPAATEADSSKIASIVGSWDGAIYSRGSADREIALTITESNPGSGDASHDVEAIVEGTPQRFVLKGGGVNLEMVPSNRNGPVGRGMVFTEVRYGGTRDLLVVRIDAQNDFAYLWRRADGEQPLQTTCKTVMGEWAQSLRDATRTARDLKIALHPSLLDYDVNRAVLAEAVAGLPASSKNDSADFRATLYACAMTMPSEMVRDDKSPVAILTDGGDISEARYVLRTGYHPEAARLKLPSTQLDTSRIEEEREQAELAVAGLSFSSGDLASTTSILAAAKRAAGVIQNARPSVVATALVPLTEGLDSRQGINAKARADMLRTFAERRMNGIAPPVGAVSPSAMEFLATVASGKASAFTPEETGFLSGLIAQSIDACSEPPEMTRLMLLDLIKRGMQLLIGTNFGGDLTSALGSQFQSQANISEGTRASKAIGCGNPYLAGVYDILAFAPTNAPPPEGQRAPLFLRSCSLDRTPSQCTCMLGVIQTLRPEADQVVFDRSIISAVINMNPAVGIELGVRCGVSNY